MLFNSIIFFSRSRSDSSPHQSELDKFFSTMGMEESVLQSDSLFSGNHVSSESDFSFAGASAYVRDSADEMMELDPVQPLPLSKQPQTVSIIEKNARVMRWLMTCRANNKKNGGSPRHSSNVPPSNGKPMIATQASLLQSTSKHSFESGDSHPVFHSCNDKIKNAPSVPPRHTRDVNLQYKQQNSFHQGKTAPPIPPRTYMRQPGYQTSPIHDIPNGIPKESDV